MSQRFAPGVGRKLLMTTLAIILLPVAVLFMVQCEWYVDLTQEWTSKWQIIASGFSAVVAVHAVVAYFMWTVYHEEILKDE